MVTRGGEIAGHLIRDREIEMRQVVDVLLRAGGDLKLLVLAKRDRRLQFAAGCIAFALLDQAQPTVA